MNFEPSLPADCDIREVGISRSIPAKFYIDPLVFEQEKHELFFKNWHYAGHISQLEEPGKYLTGNLFDQEYFLICDKEKRVRAFYNVCAHRAHRLMNGQGQKRVIVCPYHQWTYDYQGKLFGARGLNKNQTFDRDNICLEEIQVDRILDFIFINLDPNAEPLASYASGIEDQILNVVPRIHEYRRIDNADYFGGNYECNWKVIIDNFMECYHCESAHTDFSDLMDIKGTRYKFHGNFSHQIIPSARKANNRAFPLDLKEDVLDGHFWYIFPNIIISVFPGVKNISVSRCDPDGPEQTLRFFDVLAPPDVNIERQQKRAKWGMEVVNQEDKSLCENVQRGLHQRGYSQGYYLIDTCNGNTSEEGVQFFHRHYKTALNL